MIEWNEMQLAMRDALRRFIAAELAPKIDDIEHNGVPPYDLWEHLPAVGKIPPHRTDTGAYLVAEVFGARRMILLKDVDGVYTADPATTADAQLIPHIGAGELLARQLPTLPLDRAILPLLGNARLATEVQVVNGLVPGNLTRALDGEHVGTIIHR